MLHNDIQNIKIHYESRNKLRGLDADANIQTSTIYNMFD